MTLAQENARKISQLREAGAGVADLYRTTVAGPSGQRADTLVGRVRFLEDGPYEFEVYAPEGGDRAGYASPRDTGDGWYLWSQSYDGAIALEGCASSLSIAVDVLINGVHAATGRHDHRRISSGSFVAQGR